MVEVGSEGKFKNRRFAHMGDKRARIRAEVTSDDHLFVSLIKETPGYSSPSTFTRSFL
jgi:hypothetical protein